MELALPAAGGRAGTGEARHMAIVVGTAATVAAMAVAAAVAASSADTSHPTAVALARAAMVGLPAAVGLYALVRRPGERFGAVLLAAGGGWFLTTLAESSSPAAYSVGRVSGWLVEILLVYLLLSFPTGRLESRTDRRLVGAIGAIVFAFFLPRVVLAQHFELPSPYTSCTADCPANAFFSVGHEPAILDAFLRPVGFLLVVALMATVAVRLWRRMRSATPLMRRMFQAVLVIAAARTALMAAGVTLRLADPGTPAGQTIAWLLALAVPALALAFLAGMVRWDFFTGRALARLADTVQLMPDAPTLRRAFADAFHDDSIEIAFPAGPGRWMDPWGRETQAPVARDGRSVSGVRDRGVVVAAIVHDEALDAHPELIRAGTAMAAVVLDNQRLAAEAEAAMREVRQSRARLATAAERERRRIERDLHDGAQQRLVALRIELELAEDLVREDAEQGAARIHELETQVDEALSELRALAHGVYPPLLADRGLAEALRGAAGRCAVPTEVEARDVPRCAPEVESAVYFCVLEALQNVAKHAHNARRAVVTLDGTRRGELRFTVRDDGDGAEHVRPGAGLTNMRDRVSAYGGDVRIASTPRVGTQVTGRVPVELPISA